MTEYGLRIKNDSNNLQIDSIYKNYILYEHDEDIACSGSNYHTATVVFANALSSPPLIAIRNASARYCGLMYYTRSGSDYTGFYVFSEKGGAATFDWQAFIPISAKSSDTYGLRVYNSDEELVFDGGYPQMIIQSVATTSPAYNSVSNVDHTSDANAYHIISPYSRWTTLVGGFWPPGSQLRGWGCLQKKSSNTRISVGGMYFYSGYIPANQTDSGGYWASSHTVITVKKAF